jgi:hypothetical protein
MCLNRALTNFCDTLEERVERLRACRDPGADVEDGSPEQYLSQTFADIVLFLQTSVAHFLDDNINDLVKGPDNLRDIFQRVKADSRAKRAPRSDMRCGMCNQPPPDGSKLRRCGRCKVTWYCSVDHQREDFVGTYRGASMRIRRPRNDERGLDRSIVVEQELVETFQFRSVYVF